MFKATRDIASLIAHSLNLTTDEVWDIIKGRRYNSVEELEMAVCKAMAEA
jgi:energy-converting hydrogenase A subunit M